MLGAADAVPGPIRGILGELERDILADPYGRLSLGGRIRLWEAIRSEYGPEESELRRSTLAYVVVREAASTWDPSKLPGDLATDERFEVFPGAYLEAARRNLLGEISGDDLREVFGPLWDYVEWVEVVNIDGYWAMLELQSRLLGEDDERYEDRGYFEVVRGPGPEYREIFEDDEYDRDVHHVAAIQASGPGDGEDRGGPAEIASRREFWLRWLRETLPLALGPRDSVLDLIRRRTPPPKGTARP